MKSLRLTIIGFLFSLAVPAGARAQAVKPRFAFVVDTSSSMLQTPDSAETDTHGDGSLMHPGCDIDGNGFYDDSRIYQAKAALADTIAAFGSAEFALGQYKATLLGQSCTTNAECSARVSGATCVDPPDVAGTATYCAYVRPSGNDYDECTGSGQGCVRCANPASDPTQIYEASGGCSGGCLYPACKGGKVLVGFPSGSSNYNEMYKWIDGKEDQPPFTSSSNREMRSSSSTPLASATDSMREWLTDAASTLGPGAGPMATDTKIACRSYNVIVITDGAESCSGDPIASARNTYHRCTNNGFWDDTDRRCEISGNPSGTTEQLPRINVYVIGFATTASATAELQGMACAGSGGVWNGSTCSGTGVRSAIFANNRAELTARLGDIIASSIIAPKCDCDETCDGSETVSFPLKGTACTTGVGRCKRTGVYSCNGAGDGVICATAATCPATPLTPGTGVTEQCGTAPGCTAPTPEDCADDNCDGQIDENLSCVCAAKPELCNGVDDNCNNVIDDVTSVACGLNVGECKPGTTACVSDGAGGKKTECQNSIGPVAEICDNKDNNCDGVVDGFGQTCYPMGFTGCDYDVGSKTYLCRGACQAGAQICTAGAFGACSGAVKPTTEIACNGIDDDCDGQTDEGFNLGQPCGPGQSGVGECRPGALKCIGGAVVCDGGQGPVPDVCNGKDDDCDGNVDAPLGPCGLTLGECKAGVARCQGTTTVCDQPMGPRPETCNGKDDDCDGAIDNNLTEPDLVTPTSCSLNVGICKAGVLRCIGGRKVCDGGVLPAAEVCNNLDDDCDGCVDCDLPCLMALGKTCPIAGAGQACGSAVGECKRGQLLCTRGMIQCVGQQLPTAEVCDAKDNDCNGFTDEADPELAANCYPAATVGCDVAAGKCVGECQFGRKICQPMGATAGLVCANPITPKPEACDSRDNDCDGMVDEDFDVGAACDNGVQGICRKTGMKICNARGDGTTCSVSAIQMTPEVCDGEDNDCDGDIDELPLPGVGALCGSNVGECRQGHTKCVMGKIICDEVGPMPEVCNGLDDDCDGSVDEDLVPPADECPPPGLPPGKPIVGECRPGKYVCAKDAGGKWGWQCRGSVGPVMEICDNKDNDCDGMGDNNPMCPSAMYACVDGECAPKCKDEENPCPSDRVCKDGVCVIKACVKVACAKGNYCNSEGKCVDPCEGMSCPTGATCEQGVCKDCHSRTCKEGEVCGVHECMPDPCFKVECPGGQFCRSGECVKSCSGVTCPSGQTCREGACQADPCALVSCDQGKFCDPADGQCKLRPCAVIQCLPGTVCVETTGMCKDDPCTTTHCDGTNICQVSVTGEASCQTDTTLPPPVFRRISTSGGGLTNCACRVGAPDDATGSATALPWLVGLIGAASIVRKRRRARSPAKKDARLP